MLAVVEDHQDTPATQDPGERLRVEVSGRLADAHLRCHRVREARPVAQHGQLHEPHPVGKGVEQVRGDVQGETGLAHPAGAGEGYEPSRLEQLTQGIDFWVTSDEAGQRRREVGRCQWRTWPETSKWETPTAVAAGPRVRVVRPWVSRSGAS
jgi:hypothetical protein